MEIDIKGSNYDSDDELGGMISDDFDFKSVVYTLKDSYIQPPVSRKYSASFGEALATGRDLAIHPEKWNVLTWLQVMNGENLVKLRIYHIPSKIST